MVKLNWLKCTNLHTSRSLNFSLKIEIKSVILLCSWFQTNIEMREEGEKYWLKKKRIYDYSSENDNENAEEE